MSWPKDPEAARQMLDDLVAEFNAAYAEMMGDPGILTTPVDQRLKGNPLVRP